MKTAALALLLLLAAAPAARWLQTAPACCPLAGKGMACCPTAGTSGGCQLKSGCPETPAASSAAPSFRAALPPGKPRIFLVRARASVSSPFVPGGAGLAAPLVPPPRG